MTLKYTCHSQISLCIEGTFPPWYICIHIKQSKTDSFRQGTHIYLGRTYQQICPIKAIVSYLAVRSSNPGPVFTLPNDSMLTRDIFGSELDKILEKLALQTRHYNTHSFRIGAATSAKQAGNQRYTLRLWEDGKAMPTSATSEPPSTTGQPVKAMDT